MTPNARPLIGTLQKPRHRDTGGYSPNRLPLAVKMILSRFEKG
jgi:hypothetical protein